MTSCQVCRRKLSIMTMFDCECGKILCSTHRYPFTHVCSVDKKEKNKDKIKEENQVVVNDKLLKI